MPNSHLKTWIEIDRAALRNNYRIFRKIVSDEGLLMSVVKSNAYGHGLVDFSLAAEILGVDWFGVDSVIEALHLREAGIKKPILVLGYTLKDNFLAAARNKISIAVSSVDALGDLDDYARKGRRGQGGKLPRVHLKIDTGMHRQGFLIPDLPGAIKFIKTRLPGLTVEGVFTHFSSAKNPAFPQETIKQIGEFKKVIDLLKSAGFKPIAHAAATSGTILFPESHFDMVRVGIGFYGLWPSKETKAAYSDKLKLEPILCWKTIISEIKILPKGSRLGYDLTETLGRDSKVAVLPVGYWHGYPRALSGIGKVLIRGHIAKVLGRVSMDVLSVDVTDIKGVKAGDIAVLVGGKSESETSADNIADLSGAINYEVVTHLNPLIKRILV